MSSIAFFDSRLTDLETLIAALPADAEVVLIDSNRDGLEQMAQAVTGRRGLDAVHVFSHGASGSLLLGSTLIDGDYLDTHSAVLSRIGKALKDDGDVLLYGCNVAQGDEGRLFVERLAQLTGADVAASTDLTGNAVLGGDWNLEVKTGVLDNDIISINYDQVLSIGNYTSVATKAEIIASLKKPLQLWSSVLAPSIPKTTITFGINTSNPTNSSQVPKPTEAVDGSLVKMSAKQIETARLSFRLWDDLIPSSLVESGEAGANITLNYSSNTDTHTDSKGIVRHGTYTKSTIDNSLISSLFFITSSQIWLDSNDPSNGDAWMNNGDYGLLTMLHEIGHSLGLSHPGSYNFEATYKADAKFAQDSRQNTVMSYFGKYDTWANIWILEGSTFGVPKYPQTPMVYDIATIQSLYGADTTTRTGNTTYGYNCNFSSDDVEKNIFDFSINKTPIFTIWDAGGNNDTLDCSGWTKGDQTIDLTPGKYSSVLGLKDNVGIAFGTIIENAIGGSGTDKIIGNDAKNKLVSGGGADMLDGGAGDDSIIAESNNIVIGGTGNDTVDFSQSTTGISTNLPNTSNNSTVTEVEVYKGSAFNDTIAIKENINTVVYDGKGSDIVAGGSGNEIYYSDLDDNADYYYGSYFGSGGTSTYIFNGNYGANNIGDIKATDTIIVDGVNLHDYVFTRLDPISLTYVNNGVLMGIDANNDVTSFAFNGGARSINILGGLASGYISVNYFSASGGAATLGSPAVTSGSNDADVLSGTGGTDTLEGFDGIDYLSGGFGADVMIGGTGDDTYVVDNVGDIVTELPNQGNDIILSSIDYSLVDTDGAGANGSNVENLILTGAAVNGIGNGFDNTMTGNYGNNSLDGGLGNDELNGLGGNDTLNGGDGNDFLNGGAGIDSMTGGLGNDTYMVDDIGDMVTETSTLTTEIDSVNSSISYILGANVENVTLNGTATIDGTGNTLNNVINGNSANNILNAGLGNDTLNGGGGNDTLNGDAGTDIAVYGAWSNYTITGNSVSATVTDLTGIDGTDTLSNIENLTFNGISVTIEQAVNDAPVGVSDNNASDSVVEATENVAGDSIAIGNVLTNDTDADSTLGLGETKTVQTVNNLIANVGTAVVGLYGSLTLLADGSYTYTLDDAKAATNALSAGQVVADSFTYTVVDAHGASSASTTLAINITGSDDTITNTAPTNLTISASNINENVAAGSVIGTFSSTDSNIGDTFTYTLVTGTGSTDNSAFSIVGNQLKISSSPNFESKASYSILVRTTDQGGLFFDKALTIVINNVNETPTNLAISASSVNENVAAGSVVGTLSSTDPDAGNTFTYSLAIGGVDNSAFSIVGNQLKISSSPNFENKASYSTLVRTTDQGGLFFDKVLTITINNLVETTVNHAPTLTSTATTLAKGLQNTAYTISKTSLLQGWTDSDGDILAVSNFTASNGSVSLSADGSYTIVPTNNYVGAVTLNYQVIDGNGGITPTTLSYTLIATNDPEQMIEVGKTRTPSAKYFYVGKVFMSYNVASETFKGSASAIDTVSYYAAVAGVTVSLETTTNRRRRHRHTTTHRQPHRQSRQRQTHRQRRRQRTGRRGGGGQPDRRQRQRYLPD